VPCVSLARGIVNDVRHCCQLLFPEHYISSTGLETMGLEQFFQTHRAAEGAFRLPPERHLAAGNVHGRRNPLTRPTRWFLLTAGGPHCFQIERMRL